MTDTATIAGPRPTRAGWAPQLVADLMGLLAIAAVVTTTWIWVRGGGLLQTFVYPEYLLEPEAKAFQPPPPPTRRLSAAHASDAEPS